MLRNLTHTSNIAGKVKYKNKIMFHIVHKYQVIVGIRI